MNPGGHEPDESIAVEMAAQKLLWVTSVTSLVLIISFDTIISLDDNPCMHDSIEECKVRKCKKMDDRNLLFNPPPRQDHHKRIGS